MFHLSQNELRRRIDAIDEVRQKISNHLIVIGRALREINALCTEINRQTEWIWYDQDLEMAQGAAIDEALAADPQ